MKRLPRTPRRFAASEDGGITIAAVFLFMASLILGSLAIDFSGRHAAQVDLQVLADTTAHSALVNRQELSPGNAMLAALAFGALNEGQQAKAVVKPSDIEFGTWDSDTRAFVPNPVSRSAVRVTARRNKASNNIVRGILTGLVGIEGFEIEAVSIVAAKSDPCTQNGVVAEKLVSVNSGNTFGPGYCVHSDADISFKNSNSFGAKSTVSLPNIANLTLPSSIQANPGLEGALKERPDRVEFAKLFSDFATGIELGDAAYIPGSVAYSWDNVTLVTGQQAESPATLEPGGVHVFLCTGSGSLQFETGTYRDVVVWTDCKIRFSQGTAFEGSAFVQKNTAAQAIHAPNGVRFGAIDNCAPTGDTVIMTTGGVHVASDLQMHGATLAAGGEIHFSARPDGMHGASVISGSTVSITSGGAFGFCDGERDIPWKQFRYVL